MSNKIEKPNWLVNISQNSETLVHVVERLRSKARSLDDIGMQHLADDLHALADTINHALDGIRNAVDKKIHRDLQQAQAAIVTTFADLTRPSSVCVEQHCTACGAVNVWPAFNAPPEYCAACRAKWVERVEEPGEFSVLSETKAT